MDDLNIILSEYVLSLADDELILGHRASQWCGLAPILEEDIAFANIALDELGHAGLWYGLYAGLTGQNPDSTPDRLIFQRPQQDFRCAALVELPNGDWAFSMLRQYLFDAAEVARLSGLAGSGQPDLAAIAAKAVKEELYHQRHTRAWVERLGQGSEESHRRMQAALLALWPYTGRLFSHCSNEAALAEAGLVPDAAKIKSVWEAEVLALLAACELTLPEPDSESPAKSKIERGRHLDEFPALVAELQSVARLDPLAVW